MIDYVPLNEADLRLIELFCYFCISQLTSFHFFLLIPSLNFLCVPYVVFSQAEWLVIYFRHPLLNQVFKTFEYQA